MLESYQVADRLRLRWSDGVVSEYAWIWVRDHSHDPASRHPITGQRTVATTAIDPSRRPHAVRLTAEWLEVEWSDEQPDSVLPLAFLHRHRGDPDPAGGLDRWDVDAITAAHPVVRADAVLHTEAGLATLLDHLHRHGVGLVEQTPVSVDAAQGLLERIGYVRRTIFGSMWEFGADLARADTAYTDLELAPHTDGTYSYDAPGIQLLLCLERDGSGGDTVLVDGFRIAAELRASAVELHDLLATVPVAGQYVGDGVHLRAERPVLRHDHHGRLVQVSLNHADRAPLTIAAEDTERFYAALRAFDALASDPRLQWRFALEPGTALLFDNWRILHGRTGYTGRRRMCGGYLNREDYESRRRLLVESPPEPTRSRPVA